MKNIDWSNLPFGYMRTDYNVRCYYRNGDGEHWSFARKRPSTCTWPQPAYTTDRKDLKG